MPTMAATLIGPRHGRSGSARRAWVVSAAMSITNDDIKSDWELGDRHHHDGRRRRGADGDGGRHRRRRRQGRRRRTPMATAATRTAATPDVTRRLTPVRPPGSTKRVPHPDAPGPRGARRRSGGVRRRRSLYPAAGARRRSGCLPLVTTADGLWADVLTRGARAPSFRLVRDGTTLPPSAYCRRPASGTARSTTSSSPTACSSCTTPAPPWCCRACSSPIPTSPGSPTTWRWPWTSPCRSTPTCRRRRPMASSCTSTYHDVFVVQLEGSKRWRVWEPLERTRQPVRAARRGAADVRRARRAAAWT